MTGMKVADESKLGDITPLPKYSPQLLGSLLHFHAMLIDTDYIGRSCYRTSGVC